MADDGLSTYLEDHLAGATGAIDLLQNLEEQHAGQQLGRTCGEILDEVRSDRATLAALAERVGTGEHSVKEAAARLGEKLSRWKLERGLSGLLGTLEALEALALGIWGKRALWRALQVAAPSEPRLRSEGLDLDRLIRRAEEQHEKMERLRLEAAAEAFGAPVAAPRGRAS